MLTEVKTWLGITYYDCSMAATVEHVLLIKNLFSGYFTVMRHTQHLYKLHGYMS